MAEKNVERSDCTNELFQEYINKNGLYRHEWHFVTKSSNIKGLKPTTAITYLRYSISEAPLLQRLKAYRMSARRPRTPTPTGLVQTLSP